MKNVYGMVDYFVRYEFQSRGTVHAHILLWGLIHFDRPKLIELVKDKLDGQNNVSINEFYFKMDVEKNIDEFGK